MKKLSLMLAALFVTATTQINPVMADDSSVEMLNELVRGEISAVETYNQALEKVGNEPGADKLRVFRDQHQQAVTKLSSLVTKHGGEPSKESGTWGTWAQAVTASAKVLGDAAALKALKEGEEHGINEYEEALENENLNVEAKNLIRDTLLPAQQKHIQVLDQLMQTS